MRNEVLAVLAGGAAAGATLGAIKRRKRLRQIRSRFVVDAARRLVAAGLVTATSARIWLRTDRPGPHTLVLTGPDGEAHTHRFDVPDDPATDGTFVVRWPDDAGASDLPPGTTWSFVVRREDGVEVGAGRFATAPRGPDDAPDELAIAIASCHQPFHDNGQIREASLGLLEGLEPALEQLHVEQVLLLGDQMYTDLPAHHGLFDRSFRQHAPPGRRTVLDCTREEVRALLQERYRTFWRIEPFQRLQARFSTLCMLDDHEVVDNFGSNPDHAGDRWAAFRAGAIDAFHDYQALRAVDRSQAGPEGYDVRFARGPIAGLVLDLRTRRVAEEGAIRILAESQWEGLDRFLREEAARPVLVIGLSVPIVHAPDWLVEGAGRIAPKGSGVHDRWSHPWARPDHDRMLRILATHRRAYPAQRVVLVGGDIHVGVVSELRVDGGPPIVQLVSSAVSNLEKRLNRAASAELPVAAGGTTTRDGLSCDARLLPGIEGREENPTAGLNAGVLSVLRRDGGWKLRIRILGHHPDGPSGVRVVFDSGEV